MKTNPLRKAAAIILIAAVLILPSLTFSARAADSGASAGIVSTAWGALNVRSAPHTGGAVLAKLPKGTYITLIEKTGDWWKVDYEGGRIGYVSASYITGLSGAYVSQVTAYWLNVRSGAGTGYAIINVLPKGAHVLVLSESAGWSRILFNGTQVGYVSANYLGGALLWPVPGSTQINQYFAAGSHLGIDIGASQRGTAGDPVLAAAGGKVVYAGWLNGYGYVVYLNSFYQGTPIQTRYAHLRSVPDVSAGSTVSKGQIIGSMGNTGTSSGVHLHFEVRLRSSFADCIANADSTPVNPLHYIKY